MTKYTIVDIDGTRHDVEGVITVDGVVFDPIQPKAAEKQEAIYSLEYKFVGGTTSTVTYHPKMLTLKQAEILGQTLELFLNFIEEPKNYLSDINQEILNGYTIKAQAAMQEDN